MLSISKDFFSREMIMANQIKNEFHWNAQQSPGDIL